MIRLIKPFNGVHIFWALHLTALTSSMYSTWLVRTFCFAKGIYTGLWPINGSSLLLSLSTRCKHAFEVFEAIRLGTAVEVQFGMLSFDDWGEHMVCVSSIPGGFTLLQVAAVLYLERNWSFTLQKHVTCEKTACNTWEVEFDATSSTLKDYSLGTLIYNAVNKHRGTDDSGTANDGT